MRARRVLRALLGVCAMLVCGTHVGAQQPDVPVVAAAADLNAALPELAALFRKNTGKTVKLSFGSSGAFTQQIRNGAPFELFLSADEQYVQALAAEGRTDGAGALYALGRLALFVPTGSRIRADSMLTGLSVALQAGEIRTFAIANPAHAPYGKAAQQALEARGLWSPLRPLLVLGENAAQATQFAMSGSAQGGLIPLALAQTPAVQRAGRYAVVASSLHQPLRQRAVLLKAARPTARAFFEFLQTRDARDIFQRHGFLLPPA